MASRLKAPFKGRPLADILRYADDCLNVGDDMDDRMARFTELVMFILEMDTDCDVKVDISKLTDKPTGLSPEAMIEKMDMLMYRVMSCLKSEDSEQLFLALLDVFEESILKLHQPHYVQFLVYYAAAQSKERADSLLSLLLNIVHDDQSNPIARREAIGFIGSFVCRATFLGWTHSARTAKYLVSFLHGLDIAKSSSDRVLYVLGLQTLCYMICWECNRWKDQIHSIELDWVWRSRKGLIPLLQKTRHDCPLRLVSHDILSKLYGLGGRISSQLKIFVGEALSSYKQLLPPLWKPMSESKLLVPHFPFDPFRNLPTSTPQIVSICREWEDPSNAPDAPDVAEPMRSSEFTSDEGSEVDDGVVDSANHDMGDVWSFRSISAALVGQYEASPLMGPCASPNCGPMDAFGDFSMASPTMMHLEEPTFRASDSLSDLDMGGNIVLQRIMSSRSYNPGPSA